MRQTAFSFLLALGLAAPQAAIPCGFHNYAPQPTLVDRLLDSEEVVLARAATGNPFRFEAYKALIGPLGSPDIPFLVDSVTRQRFAQDPEAAVLFAREGGYGPWQRVAFIDAPMAPVLGTVIASLPDWEYGEEAARFRYFATLVGHPDDRIHTLALRELDQADYSILRDLDIVANPGRLLARPDTRSDSDTKAISILLLGLSGDARVLGLLEQGVDSNARSEGRYLGAYATALIELGGPGAIQHLAAGYLTNPDLSLLARELLIEAIALHGETSDAELDAAILQTVSTTLWLEPRLAGAAARQFGSRSNWSLLSMLETLLAEGSVLDAADRMEVAQYVEYAREAGEGH